MNWVVGLIVLGLGDVLLIPICIFAYRWWSKRKEVRYISDEEIDALRKEVLSHDFMNPNHSKDERRP